MLITERKIRESRDGFKGGTTNIRLDHSGLYSVLDTDVLSHEDTYFENGVEIMICKRVTDNAIVHIEIEKIAAQKIIDFNLKAISYTVRRVFRQATDQQRLWGEWADNLPTKTIETIKSIIDLTDGNYSIANVAIKAMKGGKVKAA